MKRLLAIAVAAVAAMLIFAAPSFAAAEGPQGCKSSIEQEYKLESTGQCVSIYQDLAYYYELEAREKFPGGTGAVAECRITEGYLKLAGLGGLREAYGITFGDCVEFYKYLEEGGVF